MRNDVDFCIDCLYAKKIYTNVIKTILFTWIPEFKKIYQVKIFINIYILPSRENILKISMKFVMGNKSKLSSKS